MNTSLIVCTKNGGERLLRCLEHIEKLKPTDGFELLLVDNDSDDGVSLENLYRFGASTRFNCTILQAKQPGNSAGRNAALQAATGEILIFIDDDCYADADLVVEWLNVFSRAFIGFGCGMRRRFDASQSMVGCYESPTEQLIAAGGFIYRGLIEGSNMAFRRKCLEDVGPFDVRFGAGTRFAGEEWDVALRACLRGWGGGYFPGPKVAHDHQRAGTKLHERELFYDYGAGAVYAKNTFNRKGWLVAKKLLGELYRFRKDDERVRVLLKGYRDYFIRADLRA